VARNILKAFDPTDWYWYITGGLHRPDVPGEPVRDQAYSSKRGKYVPTDDPDFVAWRNAEIGLVRRDRTTDVDTEEQLKVVLAGRGLKFGVPAQ